MCGLTVARTNVFTTQTHTYTPSAEKKKSAVFHSICDAHTLQMRWARSHSLSFRPYPIQPSVWLWRACAPDECASQIVANWKKLVE